jgi:hypothetical protein
MRLKEMQSDTHITSVLHNWQHIWAWSWHTFISKLFCYETENWIHSSVCVQLTLKQSVIRIFTFWNVLFFSSNTRLIKQRKMKWVGQKGDEKCTQAFSLKRKLKGKSTWEAKE